MTAALTTAACLLSACGPEPGVDDGNGQAAGGELFPGQEGGPGPDAGAGTGGTGQSAAGRTAAGAPVSSGDGSTASGQAEAGGIPGGAAGGAASAAAAGTGAAARSAPSHPIQGEITQTDEEILQELQTYLNEDSSYGFLLSSYDIPEDIDLNQVFYSGAGFAQEELTDKEEELLLDRIPQEEIRTPVVKVTEEQINELLDQKAGISYDESRHPFTEEDGWAHINRYSTWYALRGDTNRRYIECTDAWQQGDLYIVHYRLADQPAGEQDAADNAESASASNASVSNASASNASEAMASAESAAGAKSAEVSETGKTAVEEAAAEQAASETVGTEAAEETKAAAETTGETSAKAAASVIGQTAEEAQEAAPTEEKDALYRPTYEVQLQKTDDGYRFCYNIVWMQKDLIEAQSYQAELKPSGDVFFAPFYPDTEKDEKADVTFALEKDRAILAILSPMEANNIRTDRIFTGVDAVDFTDYNQDGYTDILTVCSYTQISEDGKKSGNIREARVYTGQEDAVPVLDMEKTEAVNRDVEVLNITNVTTYLTGKSDGKAQKYSSWKEAFADYISGIDEEEYAGFDLIYLNEDRTPELVMVGATSAKGATIVVYRGGTLEETWLNRRNFQYLENENLLYSPSGVENLHFDIIYGISSGKLDISVQGYYGNSSFARVRFDEDGKEVYDYYWEGGQVSESGYRDGINFVFDLSRAKKCDGEQVLTAAELAEKLK